MAVQICMAIDSVLVVIIFPNSYSIFFLKIFYYFNVCVCACVFQYVYMNGAGACGG